MKHKRSKRNHGNSIQSHAKLAYAKNQMAYNLRMAHSGKLPDDVAVTVLHLERMATEHAFKAGLPNQATFLR